MSERIIVQACKQTVEEVEPMVEAIWEELETSEEPAHFDETESLVEKALWWLYVVCTQWLPINKSTKIEAEKSWMR